MIVSPHRYWLVCHPDLQRPVGGVKQIHRLAESITSCGRQATIIQTDSQFHPGWFRSDVDTISHNEWLDLRKSNEITPTDILIFPETYISKISEYSDGLLSVVFNQNSSYTFGLPTAESFIKPSRLIELYRQPHIKHVFCVSQYDKRFLSEFIVKDASQVSLIVNGIEDVGSVSIAGKDKRILFMPRKNTLDAYVVEHLLNSSPLLSDWEIQSISNMEHHDVLALMRSSYVFLSFGHPEGFGLPVAEALASGCAVVGYSGLGGIELFELANKFSMASEIQFGDWRGFVRAVEDFVRSLAENPIEVANRLANLSSVVQSKYSLLAMRNSVDDALSLVEASV